MTGAGRLRYRKWNSRVDFSDDKQASAHLTIELKFTFKAYVSQFEPLHGIKTFVAAARAGSFTAAADELAISKSAVGKSVASLEERLGVKLFHRTTRRLSLTADGEAYYATCATALDDIASIETTLASRTAMPSGRLRIDLPSVYGRKVVLPVLLRLAQEYPALHLTTTFSDYLIDPIEEGVDLLVRFGEIKDASGLVARSLGRQALVVCASPGYLRTAGTPASIEELMQHRCVVGYRRGRPLAWSLRDETGAVVRVAPPATHQMGDGEAILAAALADCGLCQLPSSMTAAHIARGDLVPVLQESSTCVEINLVWPRTRQVLPKVRRVVDELVALQRQGLLD